jgi:hypothetical protein
MNPYPLFKSSSSQVDENRKSLGIALSVIAFVFSSPAVIYSYLKLEQFTLTKSVAFNAGFLAGTTAILISCSLGIWLSSYSYLYFRAKKSVLIFLLGLLHSAGWVFLFLLSLEIYIYIKHHSLFPAPVHARDLLNLFFYFYAYSTMLLFVLHYVFEFIESKSDPKN